MKRNLMLAAVLTALTSPALAAPAALTSGGLSGTCSGSEVSAAFTAQTTSFVTLQSAFNGAAGTITLTMSTDGGQTFAPLSVNGKALSIIAATDKVYWKLASGTDGRYFYVQDATAQYRVECNVSSAPASWNIVLNGFTTGSSVYTLGRPLNDYVRYRSTIAYTDAQAQSLYVAKFTPISTADLSNMTTGYRLGFFNTVDTEGNTIKASAFIKLSIKPSAQPRLAHMFRLGENRAIYAQSATVDSIVDGNGNALSVAYGGMLKPDGVTPFPTYTVGEQVSFDGYYIEGSGSPSDPFSTTMVHFWPTLTEAIDLMGVIKTGPLPNLTALGL